MPVVNIGICQPSHDLETYPRWLSRPAINAQEICSPVETILSYSEEGKLLDICFVSFASLLVSPLIAEETTIT